MSQKRSLSSPTPPNNIKRRKTITLDTKLEVLRRFDEGQRAVDIGAALGLPSTTVRTIRGNSVKIRKSVQSVTSTAATKISRSRSETMEKMEQLLAVWLENYVQQHSLPLGQAVIQRKAKRLFDELKEKDKENSDETFAASKGWFERFKKRYKYHNLKCTGEAASGDEAAAEVFKDTFKKIVEENGYSPKQIFNVDETALFWKKMPSRTYISREEKTAPGFKASKDCFTLMLGANAAGDKKMKPVCVYRSETPRAMKGHSKQLLPVIWKHQSKAKDGKNRKAWMTGTIFREWLTLHAIPEWKEYCRKENMDFKILLLMDNAPCHPKNLNDVSPHVKVVFLPPNTTCLIQPMDMGVIRAFKAYYTRRTFDRLIDAMDAGQYSDAREFWTNFNIMDCLDIIKHSWSEVTPDCLRGVWGRLWPEQSNFKGFDEKMQGITKKIVSLARKVGFDEVDEEDVTDLLETENTEDDDLEDLEEQIAQQTSVSDEEACKEPEPKTLTAKRLGEALDLAQKMKDIFSEDDPVPERSSKVLRAVDDALRCYKEIYLEKKKHAKQQSIHDFFKKVEDVEVKRSERQEEKEGETSEGTATTREAGSSESACGSICTSP